MSPHVSPLNANHSVVEDKESFANLVSITENNLSEALCLMLAFAQRANADINVAASIKSVLSALVMGLYVYHVCV